MMLYSVTMAHVHCSIIVQSSIIQYFNTNQRLSKLELSLKLPRSLLTSLHVMSHRTSFHNLAALTAFFLITSDPVSYSISVTSENPTEKNTLSIPCNHLAACQVCSDVLRVTNVFHYVLLQTVRNATIKQMLQRALLIWFSI